jgi:hypothetical protein
MESRNCAVVGARNGEQAGPTVWGGVEAWGAAVAGLSSWERGIRARVILHFAFYEKEHNISESKHVPSKFLRSRKVRKLSAR